MYRKQFHISIAFLIIMIAVVLVTGGLIFSYVEKDWSFLEGFYFVTMTATTVGYGDYVPNTPVSKILTIIFSLSIVPFVLYVFSMVAKFQVEHVYHKVVSLERKQKANEEELDETEKKLEANRRKINEQKRELTEQEELFARQQRKIQEQARINKEQSTEIEEHDKELDDFEKSLKNNKGKLKLAKLGKKK